MSFAFFLLSGSCAMTNQRSEIDAVVVSLRPAAVLDGVRSVAAGVVLEPDIEAFLTRLDLVKDDALTDDGREIHKLAWILGKTDAAIQILKPRLAALAPIQLLTQELAGYGAVPESGALELLRLHQALPNDIDETEFRRFLIWANGMGFLTYSKQKKTVRVSTVDLEVLESTEPIPPVGGVSPRTPFSNVVRLRRILRGLRGVVWWADPYFNRRALEEMIADLDFAEVSEIRILSSNKSSILTQTARADWALFETEVKLKAAVAEWRFDPGRDWHDRWLLDDKTGYNMPPSDLIFSSRKYSEYTPLSDRPPVETWWKRSKTW